MPEDAETRVPVESAAEPVAAPGIPAGLMERRAYRRYAVKMQAVAARVANRLPVGGSARVSVTILDISQVAIRWTAGEVFYEGELVGLNLSPADVEVPGLRCVVRVCRTRRVRAGQYEAAGIFLCVKRGSTAAAGSASGAAAPPPAPIPQAQA